jgi:hypothetical protein
MKTVFTKPPPLSVMTAPVNVAEVTFAKATSLHDAPFGETEIKPTPAVPTVKLLRVMIFTFLDGMSIRSGIQAATIVESKGLVRALRYKDEHGESRKLIFCC